MGRWSTSKVWETKASTQVKRAIQRATRFLVIQTTQVRISWSGPSNPAGIVDVTRLVNGLVPDADIHERRW